MQDWIEANGVSLRYELAGQGEQILVLIHELGGTLESWDLMLPALQENFRVLRYDQRGFGLSEKTRGGLSLSTVLADLVALLDGLGLRDPCRVLGSALGAGIALALAARWPDRVARLVVCNPATRVQGDRRAYLERRAELVERQGMRACVDETLSASYPEILRHDTARFERYRRRWLANDPHGFAAVNRMVAAMDLRDEFARVVCPTLLIAGVHDRLVPCVEVAQIARAVREGRYVEVDGGHFLAVQAPERTLEHVLPFLKEV